MNSLTSKAIIPVPPDQQCAAAVPLVALYKLPRPTLRKKNSGVSIRTLSKRHACIELITNTFNTTIEAPWRLKQQFNLAHRLAAGVPVKAISYRRTLEDLPTVAAALLEDLPRVRCLV